MCGIERIAIIIRASAQESIHQLIGGLGQRVDRVTPPFHRTQGGQKAGGRVEADCAANLRSFRRGVGEDECDASVCIRSAPQLCQTGGDSGNPLVGNFYGRARESEPGADPWAIDWAEADCGYGVAQVTDGMRRNDPSRTWSQQQAIAVD